MRRFKGALKQGSCRPLKFLTKFLIRYRALPLPLPLCSRPLTRASAKRSAASNTARSYFFVVFVAVCPATLLASSRLAADALPSVMPDALRSRAQRPTGSPAALRSTDQRCKVAARWRDLIEWAAFSRVCWQHG